jgi:hypothetical protein
MAVEDGGNALLCFSKAVSSGSHMLPVENVEQDDKLRAQLELKQIDRLERSQEYCISYRLTTLIT